MRARGKRPISCLASELTWETSDEILDEATEVAFDFPDTGDELLVALALEVEPGAVNILCEGVRQAAGVLVHHRVGQRQRALGNKVDT